MKKTQAVLFFIMTGLFLSGEGALFAKNEIVSVSLVAATSISDSLPQNALMGKKWRPDARAEYVKMHIYLDEPLSLGGIEVESCSGAFRSKLSAYINFDGDFLDLTGNESKVTGALRNKISARSVTINFGNNTNLCIQSVKLLDQNMQPIRISVPETVHSEVSATGTLAPVQSYDIMNLFDSRMENGWSSNGRVSGDEIKMEFSEKKSIIKLRIWNGYQRSDKHCYENSRVRTLEITGDGNYNQTVAVKDIMGYQDIPLAEKFTGKKLTIKIAAAYPGKTYKDLVISEMRFFDGKNWFMPDPIARLKAIAEENRNLFGKSGLDEILDKTIRSDEGLTFRLRSDGSFFLEHQFAVYQRNAQEHYFYALGNYEVKGNGSDEVHLRIFGYLRKRITEYSMDCNGCGKDCNVQNRGEQAGPGETEGIFQDFITLKKKGEDYSIANTGKKTRIPIDPEMIIKLESVP